MEKNRLMMSIIIVLLVILIGAVGGVSVFVVKALKPSEEAAVKSAENVKLSIDDIEKVTLSSPISTNLLTGGDGLDHYVKINLSIGVNKMDKKESAKIIESLNANEMVTRDIILNTLRNMTLEELSLPEGQEMLKSALRDRMQQEYESNLIVQVYISDLAFS
ncbi:MAG: flagellar basal body-associated FliL family protein [Clostridiales bacterium]|jgi:flagellar basal body-associated protein FliL|nr:flagellar basal body-associated FliL family protein [Clostridiales bacterium]